MIYALLLTTRMLAAESTNSRPNVIVIITDDQGHGDLGFHGNPKIRTPNLDKLARESTRFTHFYVSPVCSPTRASLMTGRYNYRTGVVDTYQGRSMMHTDEITLAEMLSAVGYRTGIFGKWHLGDNYPMRPMDQGFQESLVLKGGGIGQASDPLGGESYFDTILQHNGQPVRTKGYVSDVIADAAVRYITDRRDNPFFVWLAFNCPHTPLEVPDRYYQKYKAMNLKREDFPGAGHPIPKNFDSDITAKIYAMVENIDDNVGRLLAKLDELKVADNTIVIFLTDNGPQQPRYNSGMLERKGSTHEGGIRVPFFVRWPGRFPADRELNQIAAHIDLAPTLLDLCAVPSPDKVKFDGLSLAPLLRGERVQWPERTLYFQWHRGNEPQLYRAFAARSQRYKLVQPGGVPEGFWTNAPIFKLYDMANDPLETTDIAARHPEIVEKMRGGYEAWFKDVSSTRGFAPPRSVLGTTNANPVILTRQDLRRPSDVAGSKTPGHWEVTVARGGKFDIKFLFPPAQKPATATFSLGNTTLKQKLRSNQRECVFAGVELPAGPGQLQAYIIADDDTPGAHYVEVQRID